MQLTVLDWDELSSDSHFDGAAIEISEVAENVSKTNLDTGLILRMKMSHAHSKVLSSRHYEPNAVGVENIH